MLWGTIYTSSISSLGALFSFSYERAFYIDIMICRTYDETMSSGDVVPTHSTYTSALGIYSPELHVSTPIPAVPLARGDVCIITLFVVTHHARRGL